MAVINSSERLQGTLVYLMLILAGDVELNPGPTLNDRPTIPQLRSLCKAGEAKPHVRVIKQIAACKNYQHLADFLLGSDHAATIKTIKNTCPESSQFVDKMFDEWLELDDDDPSDSAAPRTWRSLVESIKNADLPGTLAKSIRDVCNTYESTSAAAPPITTPSQPLGGSAAITTPSQPLGGSAADLGQPKFSLDDEYDEPLALPQGAHEEVKKVKDFAKNEVRIVIQSCNIAEYRAALEMLKPFQDFNAPVKYPDAELIIIVGIFAGQNTAIVRTAQGVECIEPLKRAFRIFPKAMLLLGLGICYGIKENFAKSDLQFADVLAGCEIGISKRPKVQSEGVNPREKFKEVQPLVFNIFCTDSKWDGITVCEVPEQRTAKVYVGRLCSASILINDPARMEKLREPWRQYLGGEMEGWAQFEIQAQSIIIKGISDFADGKKNDKWQLTAAKAAVSYAHYKLEKFGYIDYEELEKLSL